MRKCTWCAAATLLALASPVSGSTFVVSSVADSGAGSLRQAILDANANGAAMTDTITFALPGAGRHVIVLASALPTVSTPTIVDGYSQAGASLNGSATGFNGVITVEIAMGSLSPGLSIGAGANGSAMRGLAFRGAKAPYFDDAELLRITNVANVAIEGCAFGFAGTVAEEATAQAVRVLSSQGVTIGGMQPAARNLFGAISIGVRATSSPDLTVLGNQFFSDLTGTTALPNLRPFHGLVAIQATSSPRLRIGAPAAGNVLAWAGIAIDGAGATDQIVEGNRIGVAADGVSALPLDGAEGILLGRTFGSSITATVRNNVIGNASTGIIVTAPPGIPASTAVVAIEGNVIGYGADGATPAPVQRAAIQVLGSTRVRIGGPQPGQANLLARGLAGGIEYPGVVEITRNRIVGGPDALALSTSGSADAKAAPTPIVTSVDGDGPTKTIAGTMKGIAGAPHRLEFFGASRCDPFGRSEADVFLGEATVVPDAQGTASFSVPVAVPSGVTMVSATSYQLMPATGSTSTPSACFPPVTYSVSGQVLDPARGAMRATVTLLGGDTPRVTTTDPSGRYRFDGVPAGVPYIVEVSAPGRTFVERYLTLSEDIRGMDFFPLTGPAFGAWTRTLAEGVTGPFFSTRINILNLVGGLNDAHLSFLRADGATVTHTVPFSFLGHAVVDVASVQGMEDAAFATVVESNMPLVVDRTMRWGASRHGAHAEHSLDGPSTQWYLAEGATVGGFQTFYLLQNPGDVAASVKVRYLRGAPQPALEATYTVPPRSRFTVWTNQESFDDGAGGRALLLSAAEFSADISSDIPIVVERAMYLDGFRETFDAGHASAASTELGTRWYLAEGATGGFFDMFLLIANPNEQPAAVSIDYLLPSGQTLTRTYTVAAQSRFNVWVDQDHPLLADTATAVVVTSTNDVPILVERTMWWPGSYGQWRGAHNSTASLHPGTDWAFAGGEVGGPSNVETYVLIGNTAATPAFIRAEIIYGNGLRETSDHMIDGKARFNIPVGQVFPNTQGKTFGMRVTSLDAGSGAAPVIVEYSLYGNTATTRWMSGANAFATRLQ